MIVEGAGPFSPLGIEHHFETLSDRKFRLAGELGVFKGIYFCCPCSKGGFCKRGLHTTHLFYIFCLSYVEEHGSTMRRCTSLFL